MAPPEKYSISEYGCKRTYSKFLQLVTSHLAEDDRVATILNSIPVNWKNRFLKAIIQAGEESCLTSEGLLKLIEEEGAREADSEPIAVSINRIFCIQFNFRERNACNNLLNNLETGCNGIVSDQAKNEIIPMLFINQLPNKLKREFKESKLPSLDEIRSFSREQDLIFQNASVFSYESGKKRTLERKNSKNDEKSDEKKINDKSQSYSKGNDKKLLKKAFNNGDMRQVKKEKSYDIKFQNLSSLIDYSSIALTNALISDNLNHVKVGLDSCASINSITLDDFQKLSQDIKNSVVKEEETYILKSIHNTESITTGYFETTISLPEFEITNVPIKFFIDPNAKLTLLSYNFCKEIKLNPFTTPTNNENSDHIYLNIKFGQKCEKLKNFLNESTSKVLIDPDYEPGNKIEGKRYPFIPVKEELKEAIQEILNNQVKKNWLRKINKNELISEGWNQAIIVERPGKQPRICYSCLNLNKYIQLPEMVDLPNIRKILFEANTTVFSCWDINSAFSRITVSPECRKYFNIITPVGLYQSNVLVFGMKSSPAIYYNTMIEIMKGLEKYLIIYLDDILNIVPEDIHEEINIELLKLLRRFNFKLSNDKCCVSVKKLTFLGFQIEVGKGLYIDEERMNSLLQIKTPQSGKDLRSVLAKFQFCSAFIPNFSIGLKNLYSYINRKDNIEEEIKNDFKNLLDTVAKAVCLQTVPKDTLALKIYVDCSSSATSSILFCESKTSNVPIYIGAAQETIQNNEYLCSAFPITVSSRIKNLNHLFKESSHVVFNTFQRIILKILPYAVDFKTCDTSRNIVSLMAEAAFNHSNNIIELPNFYSSVEMPFDFLKMDHLKVIEAYKNDNDASLLFRFTSENNTNRENLIIKLDPVLRKHIKELRIDENIIYFGERLYIPKSLIPEVIEKLHFKHYSASAMESLCRKFFIFNSLYARIKNKYNSCEVCIEFRRNKKQLISGWPEVTESHERWHSDMAEYLGNRFFLVTDIFSHFTILRKMRSLHARELRKTLSNIFSDFGKTKIFVLDNATLFRAENTMEAFKNWDVYQAFSIPMCPESNGHAEKRIALAKNHIKKTLSNCKNFAECLKKCQLAINERIVRNNKTAYELFFSLTTPVEDILANYHYEPKVMNVQCKFKKCREDTTWYEGTVIEQIHKNCFRIQSNNKYFIRKGDAINFMFNGKIITQAEALSLNLSTKNLSSTESSPTRSYTPDTINSADFAQTLEANDILNCLYEDNKYRINNIENKVDCKNNTVESLEKKDIIKNTHNTDNGNLITLPLLFYLNSQKEVDKFIQKSNIKILCAIDGSCEKRRGIDYVIQTSTEIIEHSVRAGGNSSAQYLEIVAINQCIKRLHEMEEKKIIKDNDYVARSISSDLSNWIKNDFVKNDGKPFIHSSIIINSYYLSKSLNITIGKVPGHVGITLNEKADALARKAAALPASKAEKFSIPE
uniref:Uncharacterized protein n=1 Tax=Strongyloides stercoralis TaxID=6248 RepID=A0A0K0DZW5_STRER